MGLGADDYVTKPFSPWELTERVKAVLRRVQGEVMGETEVYNLVMWCYVVARSVLWVA
jgi:DNA-binding response OmpR family regulator